MTIVTHGRRAANIPQMWGTGRRVPAVIVEVMTAEHATEAPAAAGALVLLETTRATWRFTAIRGLLSIGALERLAGGPLTTGGLAGRCDVVGCDFFTDPLPPAAGGYLLARIIRNWDDEQALAISRRPRRSPIRPAALVEAIDPDDDSPHLAKDLDIRLLTILPGGGRTEPEYARLLAEAGFHPEPAVALARIQSAIVATPAS